MKYLVKFFVVTFFIIICTDTFAEQKIVVLDMKFVLNESKAGKGAQDFLKKSFTDNQKKFASIENLIELMPKHTPPNVKMFGSKCLVFFDETNLNFLSSIILKQLNFLLLQRFVLI